MLTLWYLGPKMEEEEAVLFEKGLQMDIPQPLNNVMYAAESNAISAHRGIKNQMFAVRVSAEYNDFMIFLQCLKDLDQKSPEEGRYLVFYDPSDSYHCWLRNVYGDYFPFLTIDS